MHLACPRFRLITIFLPERLPDLSATLNMTSYQPRRCPCIDIQYRTLLLGKGSAARKEIFLSSFQRSSIISARATCSSNSLWPALLGRYVGGWCSSLWSKDHFILRSNSSARRLTSILWHAGWPKSSCNRFPYRTDTRFAAKSARMMIFPRMHSL